MMVRLLFVAVLATTCSTVFAAEDGKFRVESNLKAAAAKADITPPVGTKAFGHSRDTSAIRDRIDAGVLLLDDGTTKAALVTSDLIEVWDELGKILRAEISKKTGTPPNNIMVTASHNHSAAEWKRDTEYGRHVVTSIVAAAEKAAKEMRPVTIGYGVDQIDFNVNRRKVINGRAVVRMNFEGPCDHRVKVLRFDDGKSLAPVAVLMHAVCHPCVFTWGDKLSPPYPNGYPQISGDFPGEAQRFVETVYGDKTKALFLQGCAGDIRPNLPGFPYRCGDEADIRWTGRSLGCAAVRAADKMAIREEVAKRPNLYQIRCANKLLMLPGKERLVPFEIQALKIGRFLFLTMPGEPFVEYGLNLEKAIADRATTIVVGYANGTVGYIPTAEGHREGGYEPNYSPLKAESEKIILAELERLADRVLADVFESFAPIIWDKPK